MGVRPGKFAASPCSKCGHPQTVVNPAWLRARRKDADLSLRALARRIGYSAPYLSDIESGNRRCTLDIQHAYEKLAPMQTPRGRAAR